MTIMIHGFKIICCMVPEIWSITDNFLSFRAMFCPFIPLNTWKIKILKKWKKKKKKKSLEISLVYHKWQSCDVWLLRHGAQLTDYFVILGYFLLFYFINQENQNFEKMKAISGDIQIHIIILQLHTRNDDHMIYKRKKNRKKAPGGIIILHTCTINGNHMMYGS